ncbi:uncharacterized protein NEMAJ01_1245 [Nematocida major]|uniref:uncharacterized protein n=1 Tax=Nematocida major TaxID=1912982 RepID=UPI002007B0B3|nr:uncharacterized protein NEMAJ01_1245 [Nematocida major]KAH9386349.1 hypothetical protein NEMAJ01_1245 [Nematocida major]
MLTLFIYSRGNLQQAEADSREEEQLQSGKKAEHRAGRPHLEFSTQGQIPGCWINVIKFFIIKDPMIIEEVFSKRTEKSSAAMAHRRGSAKSLKKLCKLENWAGGLVWHNQTGEYIEKF